jgi:Tol biopolymer transport system component
VTRLVKGVVGVMALAVVAVGASLAILVGWRLWDQRRAETAADREAAGDPKLQRPLVSTDGQVAFLVQERGSDDIYVSGLDGSAPVKLTHLPPGAIIERRPVWSPDGTRLAFAFVAGDEKGLSLHVFQADGSRAPQLIQSGAHSPAWSPDGQRLAFLKDGRVLVAGTNGTGTTDLSRDWPAPGNSRFVEVAWSPDSHQLGLVRTTLVGGRRKTSNLYVVQTDGSLLHNVTSYPETTYNPMEDLVWSPDGRRLAVSMYGGGGWSILTVGADNAVGTEFGRSPQLVAQYPAWAPDGKWLAWSNGRSIVITDAKGNQARELTFGRGGGFHPDWSPDGTRIAFVRERNSGALWVMNEDGSGLTLLTTLDAKYPVWRPGSRGNGRARHE